jgi:hypothetical protein
MVDASDELKLTTSYTPWGDTLSVNGTGNPSTGSGQAFTFGYFGGVMDAATGLIGACPECSEGWVTGSITIPPPGASPDLRPGQAEP